MAVCEERPMAPVNQQLACTDTNTYNPNPNTLTWERLEKLRLHRLGMANRFSRHLNPHPEVMVSKTVERPPVEPTFEQSLRSSFQAEGTKKTTTSLGSKDNAKPNSLAPFYTLGKPTCGYFFSRTTDNKKQKIGIPPSDLVSWRSFVM